MAAKIRSMLNLACSIVATFAVMLVLAAGYGPLPALGRALGPGGGVWSSAAISPTVHTESLSLLGLSHETTVSFNASGYISVRATTDYDMFLAEGYVTARMRLTQMDLERRIGEGLLSQLTGASGLSTDKFELELGLLRTAQAQWAATPRNSPAGQALIAYSAGVDDWLAQVRASGQWPTIYGLTDVHPAPWSPVDSLVTQELLTQELDFSTSPLDYALLDRSLGPALTMRWFPRYASTAQQPYDPGPYPARPLSRIQEADANAASPALAGAVSSALPTAVRQTAVTAAASTSPAAVAAVDGDLHLDSNAWAANGPLVTGGGAMLAGDPHLSTTLPSDWLEMSLGSPDYQVAGGTLPGMPGVVIGRNNHISWSLTNAETQSTLYYSERTSPARPNAYYWRGAWRSIKSVSYTIPVRGGSAARLTVGLTVHGPIMHILRQRVSVTWMGDYPSNDLAALLAVDRAASFPAFAGALRGWQAPALNFVYADDHGNIGVQLAGDIPQTAEDTRPWLPMSGTGDSDVLGTVPVVALPRAYDPPGHQVSSTNQRPAGNGYPYFLGTSLNFDAGYRASVIGQFLGSHRSMTQSDFAQLQNNVTDGLAKQIVPVIKKSLSGMHLSQAESQAAGLLFTWSYSMDARSAAASVWWEFIEAYVRDVFQPWWDARKVPSSADRGTLDTDQLSFPLLEDLQDWTLHDPGNAAFTPPGGAHRDAAQVIRAAFATAVAKLAARLGGSASAWTWGRLHSRDITALSGAAGLGYGPYPDGGDGWTVDAADGLLTSSFGPSWRMIASWSGPGQPAAAAIYPGGQSDTPTSAWYDNLVAVWRSHKYISLGPAAAMATWSLRAGG